MFKLNVGVVLGIVLFAAPAWSSLITVNNGSFENPFLGTSGVSGANYGALKGPFGWGDVVGMGSPGWTINSANQTTGVLEPNTQTPFTPNVAGPVATGATGVPVGVQVGFLQNKGSIYQDLIPITGNGYYSVTVDVGRRTDLAAGAGAYSLMLTSGSTVLATFNGDVTGIASSGGMAPGAWARETVTYDGAPIDSLRLTLTAAGNQVAFDDVQASGAPEIGGSSVFWTMIGVAGFWIYRRKRLVA